MSAWPFTNSLDPEDVIKQHETYLRGVKAAGLSLPIGPRTDEEVIEVLSECLDPETVDIIKDNFIVIYRVFKSFLTQR